jgi:hypothetical protein
MSTTSAPSDRELVEADEDADLWELCVQRGWTDGLPVVPPTIERVDAMLDDQGLRPDDIVALLPPASMPLSAETFAANAVMAGCRPTHLPYALAGLQAALDPDFNLPMVGATTGGSAITLVVSGPEGELNRAGFGTHESALGAGNRANLVVSRAVNLTIRNALELDQRNRSTLGHPGQVSLCVAEADVEGWTPLRRIRGFDPGLTVVTAFASEGPHQVANHFATEPEVLLSSIADVMASCTLMTGAYVVVLCREHADVLVRAGWDHDRTREFLAANARRGVRHLKEWGRVKGRLYDGDEQLQKAAVMHPEDVLLVVSGGAAGAFSSVIPPVGIDTLVAFPQLDPDIDEPNDEVARRSSLPVSKAVGACVDCMP